MSMKVELIRIQNVLNISKNIRVMVFIGLSIAPKDTFNRKILEAYFIKIMVPSLNNQMHNDVLTFRHAIPYVMQIINDVNTSRKACIDK